MTQRRGVTILEVVILAIIIAALMVPMLTLADRNEQDQQDFLERCLAQGLCMDMLERFKHYGLDRPMPGAAARPPEYPVAPPGEALYGPVELDPAKTTLFDKAYIEQMVSLGVVLEPQIDRTIDPDDPSLFKLSVRVVWQDHRGHRHEVKQSRYCYATPGS